MFNATHETVELTSQYPFQLPSEHLAIIENNPIQNNLFEGFITNPGNGEEKFKNLPIFI